jgi:hypothetical protein
MSKHICIVCNTTCRSAYDLRQHFQTPKHLKNEEKEQEEQEKQKDLIIQQKDIEIMKLKAQLETTTTMYTMLLNTLNKPMDIKPLEQKSEEEDSCDEEIFSGIAFEYATDEIKRNISKCDIKLFELQHTEAEQKFSIVNLRKTHIDYTHFPLYDLYCDVCRCEKSEDTVKVYLEYFEGFISSEDYKPYNKTTTDRIYFGDKNEKWLSSTKSTKLFEELKSGITTELISFHKNIYAPLIKQMEPNYKPKPLKLGWDLSKLIYALVKNK